MTAICAKQTAGVDVLLTYPTARSDVANGRKALLRGVGSERTGVRASSLSDWHFRRGLAAPRAILANYDVLRGWIGSIRG
jgi:hypothetical protein